MCRRNISLAFGEEAACAVDDIDVANLSARVVRTCTDNKVDRNEWLRLPNGRLMKTDAVDHHQSHDLIGCQDVAWDVAGAAVEFDLDTRSTEQLIAASGQQVDPLLLRFFRVAYPAFRLGQAEIGADRENAARYRGAVEHVLHELSSGKKRLESSFD
jgi:hypothetical protein